MRFHAVQPPEEYVGRQPAASRTTAPATEDAVMVMVLNSEYNQSAQEAQAADYIHNNVSGPGYCRLPASSFLLSFLPFPGPASLAPGVRTCSWLAWMDGQLPARLAVRLSVRPPACLGSWPPPPAEPPRPFLGPIKQTSTVSMPAHRQISAFKRCGLCSPGHSAILSQIHGSRPLSRDSVCRLSHE